MNWNTNTNNYIYIAIRRGPMAVPESATDVFAISDASGTDTPLYKSSFPIDMGFEKNSAGTNDWQIYSRLTEKQRLRTNDTSAETTVSTATFDFMNGYKDVSVNLPDYYAWMWKRAPNFFDVVAYTGDGTWPRNINHNLGVAPEMMWIKPRNSTGNWLVYHSGLNVDGDNAPETDYIILQSTSAAVDSATLWNDTAPTDTVFTLGSTSGVNASGYDFIAYLFASLDGVSKVGSYTGNGTSQTIDCGFTSGARFVLIKQYDNTIPANWSVFDSERGIVSGNDSQLFLNTTDAEDTGHDLVDTTPSGFIVNNDNSAFAYQEVNADGDSYIFYAIA